MTGPEEPDNLTSMESATETIKRIFEGSTSPVGAQIADESTRYKALEHAVCPKPAQTRLIAVANQKGGVGKTTSAVNLSAALARFGCKVLLIDMDPQGNASTALGAPHASGQPSVYDVIEGRKRIAEVKCTCPDFDNLDVVPASIDLSGAELEVADMADRNSLLKNAVDEFLATSEEHYDYVIIDCPPSLGLLVINAMCAVREMLIPIQAEYYALEGLTDLVGSVKRVRAEKNKNLRIVALLRVMFDTRITLQQQVSTQLEEHFGDKVFKTIIPRNVRLAEAPSYGLPGVVYDRSSKGAKAYMACAEELIERMEKKHK